MASKSKPNEIRIERIYDAPVKLVWDAWTDPEQVAQWWGPRGFTLTHHSKDLKVGGHWHYTMHGPDGTDWPNKTKYFEVEKYKKLVYDHGGNDEQAPLFRVTVLFNEIKGKTHMDMTMALPTPEAAAETKKFIKKAGGNGTWDRLAEYLGKEKSDKDIFVINRSFEAPIEKVFEMWTNPKHFASWMGPTGSSFEFFRTDIKAGGGTFYKMTDAQNNAMYGRTEYLEISAPNRLVYTQQFCDENEKICKPGFAPTWPMSMLTTVMFTAEADDQTRITLQWEPHGPVSAEELETFLKGREGMTMGWTGSFDKLEEALSK